MDRRDRNEAEGKPGRRAGNTAHIGSWRPGESAVPREVHSAVRYIRAL